MDGSDKKKPLLIGKFKKPRCFRKFTTIKKVLYKSSSRAWMNSFLFTEYLRDWNNELLDNKKKICLILDNCPAHNIAENFSQIEMIFLPPNSTGILQPMDLGIIRSFKCKFEALKLKKIISSIQEDKTVYESYKSIDLADVITFSEIAWEEVDEKIIGNCFNKILGNYEYTESNFIREDTANFEKIIIESKIHDPVNLEAYFKTEYTEGDAILDEIEESMSQKNDFEIEKNHLK